MSLKRKAAETATDATKKSKQNGSITAFFGAPKPSPNSKAPSSAAAARFDREAWISKLTDEQKELLQLELDTLHESWLPHLKDVLVNPQFLELKRFLKNELSSGKTVFPPMKDVYSWYALSIHYATGFCKLTTPSGHDTHPSTPSKSSSQDKTPTTAPTKPTASPSPSALPRPHPRHSQTSTKRSRRTTPTTSPRRRRAVC